MIKENIKNINLSKRLRAICSMVTPGERVCDVGCDHGYVCCYLVSNGIAPTALAMDVNKGPIAKASENIKNLGLENRITTRLSDGLKKYIPGEADSLIIAGMGGLLIRRILSESIDNTRDFKELILSPQSEVAEVRRFLVNSGFGIVDEDMILEDGQYYPIIKAVAVANSLELEGVEALPLEAIYEFGPCLIAQKHQVLCDYLKWRIDRHKSVLCKLIKIADTKLLDINQTDTKQTDVPDSDLKKRIEELSEQIGMIEKVLKVINES